MTTLFLRRLACDERGATAVEYAFIAAMIVVAIIGAVAAIGGNLSGAYQRVLDMF